MYGLRAQAPLVYKTATLHLMLLGGLWLCGRAITPPHHQLVPTRHLPAVVTTVALAPTKTTQKNKIQVIGGQPTSVQIPRFDIAKPVVDGNYDANANNWNVSWTDIQYITSTALPTNQPGTTVMYGHNSRALLTPTQNIAVGDQLEIITTDGSKLTYAYNGDDFVQPTDTGVLHTQASTPQLVLITCAGVWNQYRRLMYFDLVQAVAATPQPTQKVAGPSDLLQAMSAASPIDNQKPHLPWAAIAPLQDLFSSPKLSVLKQETGQVLGRSGTTDQELSLFAARDGGFGAGNRILNGLSEHKGIDNA